eukprot:CAMPEP_0203884046 /NCGR_PEP_ID=MMETSP0359-20131031/28110_1 /ASSEMBLY_ACC=CAM_ASM_000338 /TAXON_ID=268821 /ORGANISM="Scrippsiella Hangoei, Strain SHTV-5" /LENGTH=124 /DNA_ID=CAMNT_0050804409 /DNA_START=36 /DNA_END=410 /DNA_ORIENTATION=-
MATTTRRSPRRAPRLLLCLTSVAAAVVLLFCGAPPSFVLPAGAEVQCARAGLAAPWAASAVPFSSAVLAALAAAPLAAEAAEQAKGGMPSPVLGIGLLSIIVILVLIISGIAIGRALVETIDDL